MRTETSRQICDKCYEKNRHRALQEFTALWSDKDEQNGIVWYACGHVIIIKDGIVEQQFSFA